MTQWPLRKCSPRTTATAQDMARARVQEPALSALQPHLLHRYPFQPARISTRSRWKGTHGAHQVQQQIMFCNCQPWAARGQPHGRPVANCQPWAARGHGCPWPTQRSVHCSLAVHQGMDGDTDATVYKHQHPINATIHAHLHPYRANLVCNPGFYCHLRVQHTIRTAIR